MRSKPVTVRRAKLLAVSALEDSASRGLSILPEDTTRSLTDMRSLASHIGARIYYDSAIPGGVLGMTLKMKNSLVITLATSVTEDEGTHTLVLAHELAHCLLGHIDAPIVSVAHYSAATDFLDRHIQFVFSNEVEVQAHLLALMLVVPDEYLHKLTKRRGWIPTVDLSGSTHLTVDQVAARIDLYRQIHGYERTYDYLRERLSDPLHGFDEDKWRATEIAIGRLESYLLCCQHYLAGCVMGSVG
jgi:Zn-dependent peptidase ImmA (M78 family)